MNFKKVIAERRKAAAMQPPPASLQKPVDQMSEEELDAEIRKGKQELAKLGREAVQAERNAIITPRRLFLPNRKRRRYWK